MTPDGRCRTCGAPIVWAHTRTGMRIPVDPEPVANGNVEVDDTGAHGPIVHYVQADRTVVRHVSHFATCPDAAAEHRKPKAPRRGRP